MCNHHNASDLELSISPEELKPLFAIQPARHTMALIGNWVLIISTIYLCVSYFNPITYLLSVLIIGARMHALAILMHDASHFRYLKNRKWNDLITNLSTMYPLFTSIEVYRENHMKHHRHLNTEEDPDWVAKLGKRAFTFPKSKQEFMLTVLSYLLLYQGLMDAIWFLKRFGSAKKEKNQQQGSKTARLVFYIIMFSVLTITSTWSYYLLFWIVPYLSTFFMYQYIRSVAEHFGELAYDHLLTSSRTVKTNWLERFFIAPHHVGYHLEHHLYPGIPFYNLPKLHDILMSDANYHRQAHVTEGYMKGLMNELGKAIEK